jgi:parallel beta-helix repeat protein
MRAGYLLFALLLLLPIRPDLRAQGAGGSKSLTVPDNRADGDVLTAPRIAKLRLAVGGSDADIAGFTSQAIQIAIDALSTRGGGTVQLKAGSYAIMAPVRLKDNITLLGAGDSTLLRKVDGCRSLLSVDADYGMYKVTVRDASGFKPGMGVQISDSQYITDYDVTIATVTEIEGNTIFLDEHTLRDYDCAHKAVLSNTCSIVEAIGVKNARIANLRIEGNGKINDELSGCRGGAVYLHKAESCVVENVKATNFNGDVFDWQITKDITVRHCEASFSTGQGFHPGTGSEGTVVEKCTSHHNLNGIYLCWRVKQSTFRENVAYDNRRDGISINRKDTDNLFTGNHIYSNGRNGVFFNDYSEANNSHRNEFDSNIIENNGTQEPGQGFSLVSTLRDIRIHNNTIRDTGKGTQRCAILIGSRALNIDLQGNTMSGHPDGDVVHK